jgi:DNA gyrase subunit A
MVADTHDSLLFFTDRGRVFQTRAYDVPDSSRQARGTPLVNLIEMDPSELVTAVVSTTSFDKDYMLLATKLGEIKKTPLKEFESVRRAGLIAMSLEKGDELVFARLCKEDDDIMMVSAQGKAIRFSARELRAASRMSGGVRGMRLQPKDDEIVALETVEPGAMLLTTSEKGLGKRTSFDEYPRHSRGGQGVLTHNVTERTGRVVSARAVFPTHELIVMSESGIVMRTSVDSISMIGRAAQGVYVMGVGEGDRVACVATIDLSKTPAPVELKGQAIDDLAILPEPGTEKPARRRASKSGGEDGKANGARGRGKK